MAVACALTACSVKPVTFTPGLDDAGLLDGGQPNNGPDAATTARLTVIRGGAATGGVSASGLELACNETCVATVPIGAQVTLTATPDVGAVFAGWSGGCTSSAPTCTFTATADVEISARFDVAMFTVSVGLGGGGTGSVTWPGADTCPDICTKMVPYNTTLTLNATPAGSSTFLGWLGPCSGTAGCTFTVTADTSVNATFVANNELDVVRNGNGSGSVTSNPAGITCGTDCAESYAPGTQVRLTAAPAADSSFAGWSGGGCTGTGTCQVTMNAATMVTATFTLKPVVLGVTLAGSGTGSVTSNPAGITCGTDCSEAYAPGTGVTLTATPTGGSTFTGWSGGGCSGTGSCQITLAAQTTVTATFAPPAGLLLVSNFNAPVSLEVFALGANGDTAPLRTIIGSATTFVALRGVAVFNNEIFVADQGAAAIDVFPIGASGNVAPTRRIVGSSTTLSSPSGMLVFGGEIYVGQQSGSIAVFPLSGNGDIAPSRVITGVGQGHYVAIASGEIYVTDFSGGRIFVYPATASGAAVPTRTITGLANPTGILISNGEIFVSESNANQISVLAQGANGAAARLRAIAGGNPQLGFPDQLAIFAGELYVSNFSANNVVVFPVNASGNVSPTRRISGPSTGLAGPLGAFIF